MSLGGFVLDGRHELRIAIETTLAVAVVVLWIAERRRKEHYR